MGVLPSVLTGQNNPLSLKQSGPTGSITGKITNPEGDPVVSVTVWAIRTLPLQATDPITSTTTTDGGGIYAFSSLIAGSYRICVSAQGMMLLDPCSWSDSPPVWNLEGGSTAVMDVALQRGAYIHVRLDDPAGLMKAEENKGNRQPVVVQGNASTLGRQVDFLAMAEDSLGRNLRTLVPANTDVQVSVQSSLTVVDKQGNSVAGLAIAAAARATTPAATVVLSVQQ